MNTLCILRTQSFKADNNQEFPADPVTHESRKVTYESALEDIGRLNGRYVLLKDSLNAIKVAVEKKLKWDIDGEDDPYNSLLKRCEDQTIELKRIDAEYSKLQECVLAKISKLSEKIKIDKQNPIPSEKMQAIVINLLQKNISKEIIIDGFSMSVDLQKKHKEKLANLKVNWKDLQAKRDEVYTLKSWIDDN